MRNLIFLGVALLTGGLAQGQTVDPSRVRAVVVFPVSHLRTPDVAWIDLYACAQPYKLCDQWIDRIQLFDLKGAGSFSYRFDPLGSVGLVYTGAEGAQSVWIATQIYSDHWYAPVELCHAEGKSPRCRYRVQRDLVTRSLSLKLLMENS